MTKILGLDLGSNSVGWTILEKNEDGKLERIIDAGSRVIPMGQEKTNFEQGRTASKNEERRTKRMMRRLGHRYKLRRENLLKMFKELGIPTNGFARNPDKDTEQLTDVDFYGLRAKAVEQKLDSLQDFAVILYHMNQRRGYQSNRKERAQGLSGSNDNEKYIVNTTVKAVKPTGEKIGKGKNEKEELEVTLENGEVGLATDELFKAVEGKQKEVLIKKSTNKKGEKSIEFTFPDETEDEWTYRLEGLDQNLRDSGLHPGQFFHQRLKEAKEEGKDFQVRNSLVYRWRYTDEFNAIWDRQAEHYTELNDEKVRDRVLDVVLPKNYPHRSYWEKRSLKEFVRDYIIYYQRPLRTKKASISNCEYEPYKKVIPKSHPLYQEFKVWSAVNNVKMKREEGEKAFLTPEQKVELYEALNDPKKLTQKGVLSRSKAEKLLDLSGTWHLRTPNDLPGNTTRQSILNAFDKAEEEPKEYVELHEKLWNILYSLDSEEDVRTALSNNYGIEPESRLSDELAKIVFETDRGNVSAKAIRRMLPVMRTGDHYDPDELHSKSKDRIQKVLDGEVDEEVKTSTYERFKGSQEERDFQGLQYWEAASLIYRDFRERIDEDIEKPSDIQILEQNSLRNPVVEQVVNETLQIVREIWERYGKPDRVHVELARELQQSADERKRTERRMRDRQKERDAARKELIDEHGFNKPGRKDIDRLLLWKSQNFRCIYSDDPIQAASLFNGETDIDHIIPRQRLFDDSMGNKVISFRSVNKEKGNLTAYEFMKQRDWDAFEDRVKSLAKDNKISGKKKDFLLTSEVPDDFINRQLNETRYISRKVRQELERIKESKVMITSGTVTDFLRNQWGLNEVFKGLLKPRFERMEDIVYEGNKSFVNKKKHNGGEILDLEGYSKRLDHRHHSMDAIVAALTEQWMIQRLNNLNQLHDKEEWAEKSPRHFEKPHPRLEEEVRESLESIIVSHKDKHEFVKRASNKYWKRDGKTGKLQLEKQNGKPFYGVSGMLHKEQPYGLIHVFKRIPVKDSFEQADRIKEGWQKQKVQERLEAYEGDAVKAKKSLKKEPLTDLEGEELREVTVLEPKYTKRETLQGLASRSPKALDNIVDVGLREELKAHVRSIGEEKGLLKKGEELTKGVMKEAFTDEKIERFNQGRDKVVKKVKLLDHSEQLDHLSTKKDPNEKKFVDGENHSVLVVQGDKGERNVEPRTRFEALQHYQEGVPMDSEKGEVLFSLQAHEAVYVPKPGEEVELEGLRSEKERKELASRIFNYRKNSHKQMYFLPNRLADFIDAKEFGTQNCTEFLDTDEPRTKIIDKAIKIEVDRLGHVQDVLVKEPLVQH